MIPWKVLKLDWSCIACQSKSPGHVLVISCTKVAEVVGPMLGASCWQGLCWIDDKVLGITQDMWHASIGHVVVHHDPAGRPALSACARCLDTAQE